jgi:hypothetical protein
MTSGTLAKACSSMSLLTSPFHWPPQREYARNVHPISTAFSELKDGLIAATKADFISLTAFEVGLFGWMAIMAHVLFPAPHHLMPSSAAYWLLMQIGMIIGYVTSWPANVWLVRRGIKVPM